MHTLFGDILRELRRETGITQRQMARELGVSTGHLSNIENGKSPVSERLLRRILERYPQQDGQELREAAGPVHAGKSSTPFGAYLAEKREKRKETAEDTAALLGVKPSRVEMVEQGYSPVPKRWLEPLAAHYGADIGELREAAARSPARKKQGGRSPLGEMLRTLRTEAGQTRAEAATLLGIDNAALTNITYGQRKVDDAFLDLAAKTYGADRAALLDAALEGNQHKGGPDSPSSYGSWLKARRTAAGQPQKQLSEILGIPVVRIVDIERGRSKPPEWLEKAFSRYYGRPPKDTARAEKEAEIPGLTPFGELLLSIRLDRNITVDDMAETLGTGRTNLLAVSKGTSLVPDSWPGKLEEFYNVSQRRARSAARKSESSPEIRKLSEIGKLLRKIRIDRNETPDDMAARFGVGWAYIESVETGYTIMPPSWVPVLEREYGLSEREILRRLGCGSYIKVADLNPFGVCVEESGIPPEELAERINESPERFLKVMRGYQIVPQRWFLKLARLRNPDGSPVFGRKKLVEAIDRTNYSRKTFEKIKQEDAALCKT